MTINFKTARDQRRLDKCDSSFDPFTKSPCSGPVTRYNVLLPGLGTNQFELCDTHRDEISSS